MKNSSIALGIYQNLVTAEEVLSELRRQGVRRVAAIYHRSSGNLVVCSSPFTPTLLLILLLFVVVIEGIFSLFQWSPELYQLASILSLVALGGFIWLSYRFSRVDPHILKRYQEAVLNDEVLVIAQIRPSAVRRVLGILRRKGWTPSFVSPARPTAYH